ncbi:MAG: hypothetical protein LBR12_03065 [Opitutaceae bacterium]|jgi:hypothetical protein|nr:hypothetical protein [Opitutaceae bacterium]
MRRLLPVFFLLAPALHAASSAIKTNAPIKNFHLPLFDKTNRLSADLRAGQAVIPGGDVIHVADMSLSQYEYPRDAAPDSKPALTTTLAAPVATVFPREQRILGNASLRLTRPDLDVSGADWSYDHRAKKLTLNRDTRVTILAPLPAALTQPLAPSVKHTRKKNTPGNLPPAEAILQ